jgi:hypothetical protein
MRNPFFVCMLRGRTDSGLWISDKMQTKTHKKTAQPSQAKPSNTLHHDPFTQAIAKVRIIYPQTKVSAKKTKHKVGY